MGTDNLFKKAKRAKERRKRIKEREKIDSILILCEGKKTEPNYFNSKICEYMLTNVKIRGLGFNTDKVTEEALKKRNEYSQVWCVFDRDSFAKHKFNRAFQMIEKYHNIHIAYSNEAFELWYLLHFEYCNTGISRKQYITKLSDLLGQKYLKNSKDMYNLIKGKESNAIENAKRLIKSYSQDEPAENNPSTNVYELVELLNKYQN